jgi:excisionase family DNA binding protein
VTRSSWLDRSRAAPDGGAPQFLTVSQAAELMGVSVSHARREIALGKLAVHRLGTRTLRISRRDLSAYLEARRSRVR